MAARGTRSDLAEILRAAIEERFEWLVYLTVLADEEKAREDVLSRLRL